jgi:hypothetical protein
MMKRRSSYKVTFFDRHGPAGEMKIRAWSYGLMVFALVFSVTMVASRGGILGSPVALLMTLVGAATLGGFVAYGSQGLASAAGNAAQYLTAGGSSTPYEEQFSHEQALVMQRDYAGALACFEQRITLTPGDPRVLIAAADLYVQHGDNPRRAAELYREVQRIPEIKLGQDVYVSNRLADLYLGPLKEPRRALTEFRRLIERYPNSQAAKHARMALDNLKPDLLKES